MQENSECLFYRTAQSVHQFYEIGEAGGDGGCIVDCYRLVCDGAKDEEGHRDAVIKRGFDYGSADWFAAIAVNRQAVCAHL